MLSLEKKAHNDRFHRLCLSIFKLFCFPALFAFALGNAVAAEKPNVLFIVVDDMNWKLGCYGNDLGHTPHLDRLAQRSVRFERAYCNFPVCGASRTSFLSGRYPTTTGVLKNATDPRLILGEDYRFLPEYFHDHGYYTYGVGKIPHTPENIDSMKWDFHRDPQWQPEDIFANVDIQKETRNWPEEKHPDGITTRLAIKALEEKRDQSLFLTVGFHRPHAPRAAPQKYWDMFDPDTFTIPPAGQVTEGIPEIAFPPKFEPDYPEAKIRTTLHGYYSTAAFIDAQVGMLLDTLDREKLWDDTIVVFFSDHGVHLGEHGGFWNKTSLMEEAVKVPLVIHLPGGAADAVNAQPVELIDLFPTLTEACGLPPQKGVEGESLVPLLNAPTAEREKLYTFSMVLRGRKGAPMGYSVRSRNWAYSEWPDGSTQLYNHIVDPGEMVNLSGKAEHEKIQRRLASQLELFHQRHPLRTPSEAAPTAEVVAKEMPDAELRGGDPEKPNVVVIFADDLGYEDLGIHGSPDALTPHIDSLAAGGIRCTDAYVSAPVCSPSRAGLLTGRYQNRFGFEFLAQADAVAKEGKAVGIDRREITIADRMKALGYVTGCIGKWHVGDDEPFLPTNRGFDEFYGTLGQSGYLEPVLCDSRESMKGRKIKTEGYYTTDDYSRRAVEFIREHRSEPFFLYLPHFAVHTPHDATEKYLSRFADIEDPVRRNYLAVLAGLDDGVGRVLDSLRETGLEENTLVIFLSDNGGTTGSSNLPLQGRKGGVWEGGIRTPFLVRWKGKLPAGKIYRKPIISLDILPTVVVAGGGTVGESWNLDGVNLLPYFDGSKKGSPHETLYWRFGTQWAIRHGNWKLLQAREKRGGSIQIANTGPVRLFNLAEDIGEESDLAAEKPGHAAKLQARWDEWNAELPEPSWTPNPVD